MSPPPPSKSFGSLLSSGVMSSSNAADLAVPDEEPTYSAVLEPTHVIESCGPSLYNAASQAPVVIISTLVSLLLAVLPWLTLPL